MKRSLGSTNFGGGPGKRFESRRKIRKQFTNNQPHHLNRQQHQQHHQQQQHYQQQQHHQQPQHHQQQQHHQHAGMANNQQYFSNVGNAAPGIRNMMPFQSSNLNANSFPYNPSVGMNSRMWKYNIHPPPVPPSHGYDVCPQPPLPPEPPQPMTRPLPPRDNDQSLQHEPMHNTSVQTNSYHMNSPLNAQPYDSPPASDFKTLVRKKSKRKSISNRVGFHKVWNREDALRAIALEKEFAKKETSQILLLRFPDPELSRDIVNGYSDQIDSVHFQQNATPRSCYVHLKEGANADEVIDTISKIPFGSGFVSAHLKQTTSTEAVPPVVPEDVDPYTLYIGNLPTTISSRTVKEHFPTAHRIDIGFAQRMKYTRYAFVRYHSAEEALEGFRKSINTLIDSRSVIVRFRRQRGEGRVMLSSSGADNQPATANTGNEAQQSAAGPEAGASAPMVTIHRDPKSNSDGTHSLEEPEEVDSKANVMREVQQLQRSISPPNNRRRCSVEEMFKALDQRQQLLENAKTPTNIKIKEEVVNYDELSEEEEPMSLLGARYKDGELTVKPDPDQDAGHDAIFNGDSECDEEYDMEPEEEDDDYWPVPPSTESKDEATNNASGSISAAKWSSIAKEEPDVIETKPSLEELRDNMNNTTAATNSDLPFPFPNRSSEIEKLYEQQRKFREQERGTRPPDELDDMFARMNSDEEDDDYY